ncbi:isoprenoid synthase domain-containing protein [Rhypophila decipiens]|uniref:Terpene synthase n=1 Tax=Rhypophila decipiens TaxID=261697 RepID=A0AAN6XZS0_9PEZI|nr:isoprenoid synthase domain-containing protein [Rhypophila decipiens]
MESTEMIKLPDFLANWPWKRELSPHYEMVKTETDSWVRSFGFFKDAKSQDAFDRVQTPRLAALAYLHMNKDQLRMASDFIALLYVYDEYTDVADEQEAQSLGQIVLDAMYNPDKSRPAGENPVGELARQFWTRAIPHLSQTSQEHFLATFEKYVDSVVVQTRERRSGNERLLSFDEYWVIRQWNSACPACFALAELDLYMPDAVYRHPMLEKLRMIAVQMIVASNDVYSYNVEVLRGMGLFNLVTIIMYEHGLESTEQAIAWIDEWNGQLLVEFLDIRDKIIQGEVTTREESRSEEALRQVKQYVDILGCWVRANEEWNFESHRYLGTDGPRVRRERTLAMMPKVDINPKVLMGYGPCNDGTNSERIRQLMDETAVAGMQITTKTF